MSEVWFYVTRFMSFPKSVEVLKETEKCLYIKSSYGKDRRVLKENSWEKYFPDIESAQKWIDDRKSKESQQILAQRIQRAAPDLLEALQTLVSFADASDIFLGGNNMNKARAAIVKAEGNV